jgi:hypothetical protein
MWILTLHHNPEHPTYYTHKGWTRNKNRAESMSKIELETMFNRYTLRVSNTVVIEEVKDVRLKEEPNEQSNVQSTHSTTSRRS